MLTFGITTDGKNLDRLVQMVKSINDMMHGRHEIIIVGLDSSYSNHLIKCIGFDSEQYPGWITKKKNIITEKALGETIVYTHDYIEFLPGWNNGWLLFSHENEWDIGMNVLLTQDGKRFRDWCVWDDPKYGETWTQHEPWCPPEGVTYKGKPCLVPYDYNHTNHMYVSGTYWLARKQVMIDNPLNENLKWGQAEDIEWSLRVRDKYKYKMNVQSTCKLMKQKDVILPYVELKNE